MGFISPIATNLDGSLRQTGGLQQLGRNDFLKLLITKLQHQDPLNPVEDGDFIAQLAQFSNLEQMNNLSEGIQESNQLGLLQTQSLNNVMASGLIGREISADFNGTAGVTIDGDNTPVIAFSTNQFASEVEFVIRDSSGKEVARLTKENVAIGNNSIEWNGEDSQGKPVPDGFYTVEAIGHTPSGSEFTPDLPLVGIVESVIFRDGAAFFQIDGFEIGLGQVRTIGQAGSFTGKNQE